MIGCNLTLVMLECSRCLGAGVLDGGFKNQAGSLVHYSFALLTPDFEI